NTVTTFNPAFRINTWTAGTVPEFVEVDNQVLNRGYQYNVYLNTAGAGGGELVLQFNKTLPPGNHVFYISHKTGLAVTLRSFEAKGGDGVDTLTWTTESEFENLGYNVYRRLSASQIDSAFADGNQVAGAGDSTLDTIPSHRLTADELAALGYVRINPKLIPGAKGGSAATTQAYGFIDRTAAYGVAYDYLLESMDFNGNHEQFGPRTARSANPLTTELYSNYPNPFNPITTLRFSLKDKVKVSLIIYDSKGRLVRILVRPEKTMLPGKYRLIWDARDEGGMEAPSGQYFYRFTAARYVKTRKMMLIK
ncbi:MAG: Por secretion system C-terminal sorting protein, partial [Fibrobacteres bacterium]|nr:Por secretion system C-terminal sorting protein [Fibrobacterota bacterium]